MQIASDAYHNVDTLGAAAFRWESAFPCVIAAVSVVSAPLYFLTGPGRHQRLLCMWQRLLSRFKFKSRRVVMACSPASC